MRVKIFCFAILATLFFTACNTSYDLRFKPVTGSRYEVRMTTNSVTGQDLGGEKMDVKTLTELVMQYEVKSAGAADSLKMIRVTFKSMKNTQGINGQEAVTDSNNPDTGNVGARMMKAIMGAEFNVAINAKGEVTGVEGKDGLVSKILAAAASADEETKAQMVAGIQNFMSEEILKNMLEQSFKIFPSTKVKTGDTWKNSMVITKPMPMNITTTFTLKNANEKQATLGLSSVVTRGAGGMLMMGVQIETELAGTQTGTMLIDMETGMPLNSDLSQNISGKMKAMGQEIPMTIQSVVTMKATKL